MIRLKKTHLALASAVLLLTLGLMACDQSTPTAESPVAAALTSTSPVYTYGVPDPVLIEGAYASLTRTPNGVNSMFVTNGLEPGHAYTLWMILYNEPSECYTAPGPCTDDDMWNDAAKPDFLYVTGRIANGTGRATFSGRTRVGDVSGTVQVVAGLPSYGLINPASAEIQLYVHHHGEKIPEFMPDMIQTLAGGCQDAGTGPDTPWTDYSISPGYGGEYGELGPNECATIQAAILLP